MDFRVNNHDLLEYQKSSTELVAYSRLANKAVTMSWPTYNGHKITPKGFKTYLRKRGLFIECFCGFLSDRAHPRSCQLVLSNVTEHVLALCHFSSSRCGFKMNLTEIFAKSLLKSSYSGLPTLETNNVPELETLLVAFQLRLFPDHDLAPHFEGYLGEHVSQGYPEGTRQLSSPLLLRRPSNATALNRRRHSSPYIRSQHQVSRSSARYLEIDDFPDHRVISAPAHTQNAAIASSSRVTLESASHRRHSLAPFPLQLHRREQAEGKEARFLRKLMSGQGVGEDTWDGIVEKCTKCARFFTASALKGHVKLCLGQITID